MANNVVELMAEPDDCAFDQPCKFGHRVEGHAVYCHNDAWADSPRKCRRSWYTGGETKDEDCPGYQPNPAFDGTPSPTPLSGLRCKRCGGSKLIPSDRKTAETCPRCMGDGIEPSKVDMTRYEQDTLELGCGHSGRNPAQHDYYVRIAENEAERNGVDRLCDLGLIHLRSITCTKSGAAVYLVKLTAKGDAVMRANWGWLDKPENN